MQTIIGRLVANAAIKETKDGRKLAAFTFAQNDRFKVKGSGEIKQATNFLTALTGSLPALRRILKKECWYKSPEELA